MTDKTLTIYPTINEAKEMTNPCQDGTVRNVLLTIGGFKQLSNNRIVDPTGNDMDLDIFLSSLNVSNNTREPIYSKHHDLIVKVGGNLYFRVVPSSENNIIHTDGTIKLNIDLTTSTEGQSIDGYVGAVDLDINTSTFNVTYEILNRTITTEDILNHSKSKTYEDKVKKLKGINSTPIDISACTKALTQDQLDYLWSLMPRWVKELPEGDDPEHDMIYGTSSKQGDIDVHNTVVRLLNQKHNICNNI
jgi:hypothetical protein